MLWRLPSSSLHEETGRRTGGDLSLTRCLAFGVGVSSLFLQKEGAWIPYRLHVNHPHSLIAWMFKRPMAPSGLVSAPGFWRYLFCSLRWLFTSCFSSFLCWGLPKILSIALPPALGTL